MQIYIRRDPAPSAHSWTMRMMSTKKNANNTTDARKTMLLGKGRENEILVRHGQKTKLGLSSLVTPLPNIPPDANRYLGLNQLVAFALRVPARGSMKLTKPRLLIVRQKMLPTHRNHDHRH